MDLATKAAVGFLGLVLVGFIWWVVSSARREGRRTRAEAWAQAQAARAPVAVVDVELRERQADALPIPAPRDGRHHLGGVSFEEAVTVPMLLARNVEEIDPPLIRPYMQDDMPTREIVICQEEPSTAWTEPSAQPLPAWFREKPQS